MAAGIVEGQLHGYWDCRGTTPWQLGLRRDNSMAAGIVESQLDVSPVDVHEAPSDDSPYAELTIDS